MKQTIDQGALAQVFTEARTFPTWQQREVRDDTLLTLYELVKWGPTSMNCQPMRLVFVKSDDAKARLLPAVAAGNVDKVKAAPVTAIIGHDLAFYDHLVTQAPHSKDAYKIFEGKETLTQSTAFRNGSMQGGYLILAARALGLDTGPMSGFNNARVDEEFFAGTRIRSNFIMNLGYGDESGLYPRGPRLAFKQVASII